MDESDLASMIEDVNPTPVGPDVGLHLNLAKCEQFARPPSPEAEAVAHVV